jgi:hypothetical protein
MPLIKVCVASIPIGLAKSIEDTKKRVWDTWSKTAKGAWVQYYAKQITMELENSWADGGIIIHIFADLDNESIVAYKLAWATE